MNVDDPGSDAFRYLSYLNDFGNGRKGGGPIADLGWDLGLGNNEIRDVTQYLRSIGMLVVRSGAERGYIGIDDILSCSASISERGRKQVRSVRETANNAGER